MKTCMTKSIYDSYLKCRTTIIKVPLSAPFSGSNVRRGYTLIFVMLFFFSGFSQTVIEGETINNTETGFWNGRTVDFSEPLNLIYRNNSITAKNSVGYFLNFRLEGAGADSGNLNAMVISGNKFTWEGIMNSITHGLFFGYQKNCDIKYNYLDSIPYGMVIKSGIPGTPSTSMTYTSGGVSYNIIRNSRLGVLIKGMNGVKIHNNTFYTSRVDLNFGLIDVSSNEDNISDK